MTKTLRTLKCPVRCLVLSHESWLMIRNDFRFKDQELSIDVQFHRRLLDQIRLDSLKPLLVHVTWIQLLRFRFHPGP